MRTTKPISTISYNTSSYLVQKLNELRGAGKISFWSFVTHDPEEDEKKEHHHVFIMPSCMVQTDDIREYLKEFDPNCPDKPLGCLIFQSSKFDDWYMYGLHDPEYLASKGEAREFIYSRDNFKFSDEDDFDYLISTVDKGKLSPYIAMKHAQRSGLSFAQYVQSSGVPITQFQSFAKAWDMLKNEHNKVFRNDKMGHE